MKKAWLLGSVVLAAVAASAALRLSDKIVWPQAFAALGLGKAADGKPDVTLEFAPREVVQPSAGAHARGGASSPARWWRRSTAMVRAKAAGTLVSLSVAEGSRVRAGQVLGRIDLAEICSRVAERSARRSSRRARSWPQAERTHATQRAPGRRSSSSRRPRWTTRAPALDDGARAARRRAGALDTARVGLRDARAGGADRRHRRQAPRAAGREAQRRAAGADASSTWRGSSWPAASARTRWRGWRRACRCRCRSKAWTQPVAGRIARIAPAAEPGTRSIGVTVALANPKETPARRPVRAGARGAGRRRAQRLTLPARGGRQQRRARTMSG